METTKQRRATTQTIIMWTNESKLVVLVLVLRLTEVPRLCSDARVVTVRESCIASVRALSRHCRVRLEGKSAPKTPPLRAARNWIIQPEIAAILIALVQRVTHCHWSDPVMQSFLMTTMTSEPMCRNDLLTVVDDYKAFDYKAFDYKAYWIAYDSRVKSWLTIGRPKPLLSYILLRIFCFIIGFPAELKYRLAAAVL